MKKLFLLTALSCLFSLQVFSQYSVQGKITDENNDPLIGAHVFLLETYKTTVSDNDGNYVFKNIPEGEYNIRVTYIGHETLTKSVDLNRDITLDFHMEMKPIMEDEVIITAVRADRKSPTTYDNLTKEEIEEINFGQDLPYLIENSPSVVVSSDAGAGVGYTGIRIRGTDITRINVTINGIPLNDPESQGVFWVNTPDLSSSIDQIQIQRGVGTSTNGASAFGASINIQTTQLRDEPYAQINSMAGSFNTFKNNAVFGTGLIDGKWSFDGRLSKINTDGYIDRAFSDLKSFYFSGGYYGKKSMIKYVMFSGKERTYQAWSGVPKDSLETNRTYNPYTYENETDNYQQDHYQLHFTHQFNKNLYLNTSLFLIHGEGYYEQYKNDQDFEDYVLPDIEIGDSLITSTDLIRQKWLDNDYYGVTWSLKYNKNKLRTTLGGAYNQYTGDHFGEVIWAQFASNMDKGYRWYENTGDKIGLNVFGKVNYQITNNLNLYGDLQYRRVSYDIDGIHDDLRNITQQHEFNFFNPKGGLFYDFNENNSAYFSIAVSNREPNRSNYRDAYEGYQPEAERLIDYELGYKLSRPAFGLEANLFYMDYKDQLVLTGEINDVGAAIMTNVPESYRAGIELAAGMKIFSKMNWDVNATFSRNKIIDFTAFFDNWSPPYEQITEDIGTTDLSFSPDVVAGSRITFHPVAGMDFLFISKYVGRQYIDNTGSKQRSLDPYFVNDLVINYALDLKLVRKLSLHLAVNNIFGEEYETWAWVYRYFYESQEYEMNGYFPQAGINFTAGLTVGF
ncbi:MAG: TonB-dependent receptor [Bacteroidales bacterium]|nr:TonB-dependent receptor [Bacteroidales bacterium]MCF8344101.1 TonB-dependent receptor [Bacteroidales bacterium]MCF8375774.1 TonB-dependent receptor [Bacteroidales bacterium]